MEMQKRTGAQTIRGYWNAMKKVCEKVGLPVPPMKETARKLAAHIGTKAENDPCVIDAVRWLTAKSGGTPAERKARADRRKERKAANFAARLANKGKGKLSPFGEGKGK